VNEVTQRTMRRLGTLGLLAQTCAAGAVFHLATSCAADPDPEEEAPMPTETGSTGAATTSSPPATASAPATSTQPTQAATTSPPATSASSGPAPEWSRSGLTCGAIGMACENCADDSDTLCYLGEEFVCVPKDSTGGLLCSRGSCPTERPYCMDRNCMTLEEANCLCTGDPGSSVPDCALPPADHVAP
jgi:hypothetical protein